MGSATGFLDVQSVTMSFGTGDAAVLAINDVSLSITENEFVCVVGPSGCGKTTLLRILAGLTRPSSGQALLRGSRIVEPREDVGIVFQSPVLLPWVSIRGNVELPARVRGHGARAAGERAAELLTLVGLDGFGARYPRELSGGMQQRAGIARSLVLDPAILLMDEPFGALDALTKQTMNQELERIWQASRKTVLMITHDIAEAVALADRVIVMSPRPGRFLLDVRIDLPRPRDTEMRATPEFAGYVRELERALGL